MSFVFRPGLAIATLVALSILLALGTWQLHRRDWKEDLIARAASRISAPAIPFSEAVARAEAGEDMEYARVAVTGVYTHDLEAPVFGTLNGAAGVYIFTPLRTAAPNGGTRIVFVNRGFAPQAASAPEARADGLVAGEVTVTGLFRAAERPAGLAKLFRPADQPAQNLYFTRDPAAFAAPNGTADSGYYLDSDGADNPGVYPEGGTTRLDFPNRHLEYALTWYGLAATLVGVFLAFSLRRR